MEAGFSRMNDLTVLQASQGLAVYIEKTVPDAKKRGIVIGHDHRHHSDDFARLTAFAFIQKGFKVWYYKELVHTPLVVSGGCFIWKFMGSTVNLRVIILLLALYH